MGARSKVLLAGGGLVAVLLSFGMAPVARTAPAPAPVPGAVPPGPSLARLRPLWSARGLMEGSSGRTGTSVRAGTVFAFAYDTQVALVALDLRTGRERWRMPMPHEHRPEIVLAGDLALVYRSIGVTAVDLATGQQRWTRRLCRFQSPLETFADLRVGVAMCKAPDPPEDPEQRPRLIWSKNMAVAVDLVTGRELWRRPSGWPSQAIVAAAGVVYLAADTNEIKQNGVTVFALDPRTGKELRSFSLPHVPGHIQVFPGDPTRALFTGSELVAASLIDGRVLWRQPAPLPLTSGILPFPRPELRDGRLVVAYESQVRELDLRSGAIVASWDIPWAATDRGQPVRQTVRPAPGGGALLIRNRWNDPALAFQFGKPGSVPTTVVLPVKQEAVLAVEDGVVVLSNRDGTASTIEGYAAFETIAPEATALDPAARVRTILGRHARYFGRSAAGAPQHTTALAELRAVPGFEAPLAALAGDVAAPWHRAAVDAVATTAIPGAAPILLAEVMRPLGFPQLTGDPKQARELRPRFNNAILRRGDLIVALADLGDAKVADALTSLLFDAESPTGFGRRDWETWGAWVESGYGKKSWAATDSGPDGAFSACLQAPMGRPEPHAAIYRMLARLGRPRDLAALRRFDADNDAAGGWSHICDRDDAIKTKYVDPQRRSNGLGLCHGWEAGAAYRLTQAEALWLRRRRSDGSLGPPVWGADPGGDNILDRRPIKAVRLDSDGEVAISGEAGWDDTASTWSRALAPAVVFADRDRDGLTDLTETAFGTDPDRPDTDRDGIPDGRDPAPFAPPAKTDAARVHDEVVRFWTTFRAGGPVTVYADPASWGGGGGVANAGIVLHRPLSEQPPATDGNRRCQTPLTIEDIKVRGARAEATAVWPAQNGNGQRIEHKLELRKVDGTWRITDDRGSMD